MALEIEQFICRSDNFGVIAHDPSSGETMVVDAPETAPILERLEKRGLRPSLLLITHHHADHVEGNMALKERFGLRIVGPEKEAAKIPGIDETVKEGDTLTFAGREIRVIETPGHTAGHVVYHIPAENLLFAADTLFALGCGRLLERGPAEMHASLAKLKHLPAETRIYCGHEYTLSNARFALTVDPENEALKRRAAEVEKKRERNEMTLPTTLHEELETNPFLRWDDPGIRKALGMEDAADVDVFAEVRRRKDNF
ncbi:MAG TPA: hydroxyacylglutathione hydrolase [Mesorhizobium sp.]|jgi:hydroxyacylglutathione hydrolase|nr:hydroxyacylglutathione hydrolase [Mesorhizobium sp.]